MPSPQGPRNALDTSTLAGSGSIDWTVPYIFPRPGGATCALTAHAKSYQLFVSNFGFAIPAGATIDGIIVSVARYQSAGIGTVTDYEVTLGALTDNKADTVSPWPSFSGIVNYGTAGDTWGGALTVGTINSGGWGVILSAQESFGFGSATALVENVTVTVYYTGGVEAVAAGWEGCAPSRSQTRVAMVPYNA